MTYLLTGEAQQKYFISVMRGVYDLCKIVDCNSKFFLQKFLLNVYWNTVNSPELNQCNLTR